MKESFTLIELIVVIAIIAILAAIIAPNAFKAIEKAKISKTIADVDAIKTAALSYYADTGTWPPDFDSISGLINGLLVDDDGTGNPVPGWDGPYIESYSPHPWGGHMSWECFNNWVHWDNKSGCMVYLDDDQPGTAYTNNGGKVPDATMLRIDEVADDGNLSDGQLRELAVTPGELCFLLAEF